MQSIFIVSAVLHCVLGHTFNKKEQHVIWNNSFVHAVRQGHKT